MFAYEGSQHSGSALGLLELIKWVFGWCCVYDVHDLVVVANPQHCDFWQKTVGFEIFSSQEQICPHVRGAPGVLLRMNIEPILNGRQKISCFLRKLLCDPKIDPAAYVEDYLPTEEDMSELLGQEPQIVQELTHHQRAVMERFYPQALRAAEGLAPAQSLWGQPS